MRHQSTGVVVVACLLFACSNDAGPAPDRGVDARTGVDGRAADRGATDLKKTDAGPGGDGGQVALQCAGCHALQATRYATGPHAKIATSCLACHADGVAHQANPGTVKAAINWGIDGCGSCHKDHMTDYLKDDAAKAGKYGGSVKTSKYDEFPAYKKLMGGHGFTLEYNEERAHAFILKDHRDIKRKQNTVCLQCKSTPLTYYWGEWRRGVQVFGKDMTWDDAIKKIEQLAPKTAEYGASCNHCHDPHGASFRLLRKAMVGAILERGTDPYDATFNVVPKTEAELTAKLNERGTDNKLTASAKRLAGILTCAQCHVEYTCGPGVDKTVLRDDFPWRKLRDLEQYYQTKYGLVQDWNHAALKVNGIKAQHPETEFFWESKHYKGGASCTSCHMGKTASGALSHWLTSPLKQPAATCEKCHGAGYDAKGKTIEIQDKVMSAAKTVEGILDAALTKIEAASANPSFDAVKLAQAKDAFMRGLLWWEFTVVSENSAGAHNEQEATTNLGKAESEATKASVLATP